MREPIELPFEIWVDGDQNSRDGYISFVPSFLGSAKGLTFQGACDDFFHNHYGDDDHYDRINLTYWGKQLRPERKHILGDWVVNHRGGNIGVIIKIVRSELDCESYAKVYYGSNPRTHEQDVEQRKLEDIKVLNTHDVISDHELAYRLLKRVRNDVIQRTVNDDEIKRKVLG